MNFERRHDQPGPSVPSKPCHLQNNRPSVNKQSQLLSSDDNERVFQILGSEKQTLSLAVGQLFAYENDSWDDGTNGVICFVRDGAQKSYFTAVLSLETNDVLFKQTLLPDFTYEKLEPTFFTFEGKEAFVGLSFEDEFEAQDFQRTVDKVLKVVSRRQGPGGPTSDVQKPTQEKMSDPPSSVQPTPKISRLATLRNALVKLLKIDETSQKEKPCLEIGKPIRPVHVHCYENAEEFIKFLDRNGIPADIMLDEIPPDELQNLADAFQKQGAAKLISDTYDQNSKPNSHQLSIIQGSSAETPLDDNDEFQYPTEVMQPERETLTPFTSLNFGARTTPQRTLGFSSDQLLSLNQIRGMSSERCISPQIRIQDREMSLPLPAANTTPTNPIKWRPIKKVQNLEVTTPQFQSNCPHAKEHSLPPKFPTLSKDPQRLPCGNNKSNSLFTSPKPTISTPTPKSTISTENTHVFQSQPPSRTGPSTPASYNETNHHADTTSFPSGEHTQHVLPVFLRNRNPTPSGNVPQQLGRQRSPSPAPGLAVNGAVAKSTASILHEQLQRTSLASSASTPNALKHQWIPSTERTQQQQKPTFSPPTVTNAHKLRPTQFEKSADSPNQTFSARNFFGAKESADSSQTIATPAAGKPLPFGSKKFPYMPSTNASVATSSWDKNKQSPFTPPANSATSMQSPTGMALNQDSVNKLNALTSGGSQDSPTLSQQRPPLFPKQTQNNASKVASNFKNVLENQMANLNSQPNNSLKSGGPVCAFSNSPSNQGFRRAPSAPPVASKPMVPLKPQLSVKPLLPSGTPILNQNQVPVGVLTTGPCTFSSRPPAVSSSPTVQEALKKLQQHQQHPSVKAGAAKLPPTHTVSSTPQTVVTVGRSKSFNPKSENCVLKPNVTPFKHESQPQPRRLSVTEGLGNMLGKVLNNRKIYVTDKAESYDEDRFDPSEFDE